MKGARSRRSACLLGVLLVTALTGCTEEVDPTREMPASEIVSEEGPMYVNVPTKDRLGVRMPGAAASATAGGTSKAKDPSDMQSGMVAPSNDPSRPSPFTWETPGTWTEVAGTEHRAANFHAGSPEVECYVTMLSGDGGGLLMNVNRWLDQYGKPPVDSAAVDAMARIPQLGTDALLVEVDGGGEAMLATISLHGGVAVFVKMKGPRDQVFAQKSEFKSFCGSLGFRG